MTFFYHPAQVWIRRTPSMDEPCGGTLWFLGHWILTNVCVTQAGILSFAFL